MSHPYYALEKMIEMIREPNHERCARLLRENFNLFTKSSGSSSNHHVWEGGYLDHVRETMVFAVAFYGDFMREVRFNFALSDALLVLFLHDLEKPWRYAGGEEVQARLKTKAERLQFRLEKAAEYGIELAEQHKLGIKYVEGEGDDYSPHKRVSDELAAFCHICDVWSARIRHDRPLSGGDCWGGGVRYCEVKQRG